MPRKSNFGLNSLLNRLLHRKGSTVIHHTVENNPLLEAFNEIRTIHRDLIENTDRIYQEQLRNAQNADERHGNEFIHREEHNENGVYRAIVVRINAGNLNPEDAEQQLHEVLEAFGFHHEPKKKKDPKYGIFDELDETLDLKKIPGKQLGDDLLGESE
jgi:hypothetical protein